jgi:hypothetical protein
MPVIRLLASRCRSLRACSLPTSKTSGISSMSNVRSDSSQNIANDGSSAGRDCKYPHHLDASSFALCHVACQQNRKWIRFDEISHFNQQGIYVSYQQYNFTGKESWEEMNTHSSFNSARLNARPAAAPLSSILVGPALTSDIPSAPVGDVAFTPERSDAASRGFRTSLLCCCDLLTVAGSAAPVRHCWIR